MGKRKGRKETQQTLNLADESVENPEERGEKRAGFFACYLLTSICPRFKGHTYIGYTLNPRRRIRQHNGEIGSGAWRTKRKRPWEMVLCIYGFPTNIAALQFEWAWQHPVESLAVRAAASSFKSLSGLANKIKLAYTMLTLPAWQSLNLTVNLFSTKYQKYTSGFAALPEQMRTRVCSMDELPCYNVNSGVNDEWDDNEFKAVSRNQQKKDQQRQKGHLTIVQAMMHTLGTSFSFASSSYVIEEVPSPRLVELNAESDQPFKKQLTTALVANKDNQLIKSRDIISHEVEIIDVFTPSPCHPVNSASKKRRRSLASNATVSIIRGLVADIDIESEKYRWMGSARLDFSCNGSSTNIGLRKYNGSIMFVPASGFESYGEPLDL
ncbi:hypothetical protein DH2020_013955 [Rehmannia glutinosa]|uniref:Structure-specific endonuclease subunit SLX1 homolog n=1 Tax=Rehmannia glutinosa TaxID=99300 RepID=A0ABR0WZ09_REHGL